MENDFKKLENIFRMFSPQEELILQGINPDSGDTIIKQIQSILFEATNGTNKIKNLEEKLDSLYTSTDKTENTKLATQKINKINKIISLYTNKKFQKNSSMYYCDDGDVIKNEININQICGVEDKKPLDNVSICLLRNGAVTPVARNVSKVETFLNFLPSTVISRCSPYLSIELNFDRVKGDENVLTTASTLKFLMGGSTVVDGADSVMFKATSSSSSDRTYTQSGMDLFTSPQTLINMDPIANGSRYIPVLDPTRPFATLESVSIDIKGTTGIMSFKTAQVIIKLHDRSRLSELSDLIQPTIFGRTTLWLTYGWRHPIDGDSNTYADFINNNFLVKEAYAISNSSFVFDPSGQVSITLELMTKSTQEIREIGISQDPYLASLSVDRSKLINEIVAIRRELGLDQKEVSKDIRSYSILNSVESGELPDFSSQKEIEKDIKNLEKSLKSLPIEKKNELIANLNSYFRVDKNKKQYEFNVKQSNIAEGIVKEKFKSLSGPDPFLMFDRKFDQTKIDCGYAPTATHPYIKHIKKYNSKMKMSGSSKNKNVISFGKLISVFLIPSCAMTKGIEECQVFFYNINDLAGGASGTNLAEFPIDLNVFMNRYKETIEMNGTTFMSIEQFIKLAVDSQISDLNAIPYGFRFEDVLDVSNEDQKTSVKEKKQSEYDALLLGVNGGRGIFQLPVVEILVETSSVSDKNDLLEAFQSPGTSKTILKIHIYDKGLDPYPAATKILNSEGTYTATNEGAHNPYVEKQDNYSTKVITSNNDGDRDKIKKMVSKMVPTLTPGINSSAILEAGLTSRNDPVLKASQMLGLNMGRSVQGSPRGAGVGNLPLRVIPAVLSMRTIGCPLVGFTQMFFVDMNTGTTIDNVYGVNGILHQFSQGKFETTLQFAFFDAYGRYESAMALAQQVTQLEKDTQNSTQA